MQVLVPVILAVSILSLVILMLFGAAIKSLFSKQTTTPWKGRRQVIFKPSVDDFYTATRKTIEVPFVEPTQVSSAPERILPSRRLLAIETMKLPELETERMHMATRAREPMTLKPEHIGGESK